MTKKKVLHVTTSMSHGGVQVWILALIKEAQKSDIHMDILIHSKEIWPLAEEAKRYGSQLFVCPNHHNLWTLYRSIRDVNRTSGPYDAIHSHDQYLSGLVLLCGKLAGIPIRISHSHNAIKPPHLSIFRWLYNTAMTLLLPHVASHFLAVSQAAGKSLYGRKWGNHQREGIVPCGLNFDSFAAGLDAQSNIRKELGIPPSAKVVGHVGRFVYQKNHDFLLDVMALAMKRDELLWLVLVGWGDLRKEIETKAHRIGIANRTIFAGLRTDVHSLMMNCFDLFVFPSHYEGLGLVVLEAMAAGKKCLISDEIPTEADVIPELIKRLALDEGQEKWATAILDLLATPPALSQNEAYQKINQSAFAIGKSFDLLRQIYAGEV